MLKLGSSKSWKHAISVLTDGKSNSISTDAIRSYFKPLHEWLIKFNKENNVTVGWKTDDLPVKF